MGCDTHMYIEYRRKDNEEKTWRDFGSRINPGRNYFLFGIISEGVRCETTFNFPPKGMPEDAAYAARNDNRLYISEHEGDGNTTLQRAQKWVDSGHCKFINGGDGKPTWVTHPDWHSHSWLSTAEFEKAMEFYRENGHGTEPEYEALLASMKRFEELGYESRVVFWFDN